MYNDIVMDHFNHPHNVGELADSSIFYERSSEICGHTVFWYLNIEENCIRDIRFKMFGCAAAIAACSMLCTMVSGKPIPEARSISGAQLETALNGLPKFKYRCAAFIVETLQEAIKTYESKCRK